MRTVGPNAQRFALNASFPLNAQRFTLNAPAGREIERWARSGGEARAAGGEVVDVPACRAGVEIEGPAKRRDRILRVQPVQAGRPPFRLLRDRAETETDHRRRQHAARKLAS